MSAPQPGPQTQGEGEKEIPLPKLREELRLLPNPQSTSGSAGYLIFDPIANRYFEIGLEAYELLASWGRATTLEELRARRLKATGHDVPADDIKALIRFLEENCLLVEAMTGWQSYSRRAEGAKHSAFMWLVHNYLYIRIPLFKPYAFLKATLPLVSFAFTRTFYVVIAALTLAGIYLVSRQIDEFVATFNSLMTLQGAALFAASIAVIKFFHEAGHAYTATRFGCRVPSLGVSLVVMLPMLYTDVTDSWRLPPRQRMWISAAGIIAELILAGIATFLWAFLPPGTIRDIAFIVAAASWVTSLFINLNPLMRFDGYFLFADWLGINNLQARSNALGVWKMREILFGLGEPCPDQLSRSKERLLIVYAWAIWIYRVGVYTAIALTVYHYFYKLIGILLFAIEIGWFIAKPIWGEMKYWWRSRDRIGASPRSKLALAGVAGVIALLVIPWQSKISIPAVLDHAAYVRLYPPAASVVKSVLVEKNAEVAEGTPILELESPALERDLTLATLRMNLLQLRLDRRIVDREDKASSLSLEREMEKLKAEKAGIEKRIAELVVKAPISGRLAELNGSLEPGRWVSRSEELGLIVAPEKGVVVNGYVSHDDLARLKPGAKGRFEPDDVLSAAEDVEVRDVAYSGASVIEIPYLASTFGGPVAVTEDRDRGLVPNQATYLVTMTPNEVLASPMMHVKRGVVIVEGQAESIAARFWRHAASVLVRESGI